MIRKQKTTTMIYTVNTILGLLYVAPLLWMVASSFKPESRIFADMNHVLRAFIPLDFTLENYREVFVRSNLIRYIGNSSLQSSLRFSYCRLRVLF